MFLELFCFLFYNIEVLLEKFVILYKYDFFVGYNLDNYIVCIYFFIFFVGFEINFRLFIRDFDEELVKKFLKLFFGDLFDYFYLIYYGRGKLEDLIEFFVGVERRELRLKYNRII